MFTIIQFQMRILTCIAMITSSVTLVVAKPLITDLHYGADTADTSSIKVEWTDLVSSDNEKHDGDSSYYKEFSNSAVHFNTADQPIHEDSNKALKKMANMNSMDTNTDKVAKEESLLKDNRHNKDLNDSQLSEKGANGNPSATKNTFTSKTQQGADYDSDLTLQDNDTRNAVTESEPIRDTTDYANKEAIDGNIPIPMPMPMLGHDHGEYLPPEEIEPIQGEEQSPIFDYYDALDRALLDPYIEGIDSDLNSKVYEEPGEEILTIPSGQVLDYRSLVAEQIELAEEQIQIKHDELLQDQEQIDNLKRKVHQSLNTSTATSNTEFSMEVLETGPNETMYVYKGIATIPTTTAVSPTSPPPLTTTSTTTVPHADTSLANQQPPSADTPLLKNIDENEAEHVTTSSTEINTPLYKLLQKQDLHIETTKNPPKSKDSSDLSNATTFDPLNKLELPNGSWTPSCKHVSTGFYCLQPDGKGSTIVECSGENVGFEFSCGKNMMCYSAGPFDVDCRKSDLLLNE
ncbi:hypothetical protein BD408DRAFT_419092 [Parasitella parasitica]|nr:hypothetical protein BD408DRAFT_419092 [Parasitella parasitica]